MKLMVVFLIALALGQVLSVGVGLLVERYSSPYAGLVTFIGAYFAMFWVAWRCAIRITDPSPRSARELNADM